MPSLLGYLSEGVKFGYQEEEENLLLSSSPIEKMLSFFETQPFILGEMFGTKSSWKPVPRMEIVCTEVWGGREYKWASHGQEARAWRADSLRVTKECTTQIPCLKDSQFPWGLVACQDCVFVWKEQLYSMMYLRFFPQWYKTERQNHLGIHNMQVSP